MSEKKLSRAMEYIDDSLIASAMDIPENAHLNRRKKMKKLTWRKLTAIAAVFAVVVTAGILIGGIAGGSSSAVIALDVNPSIEIEVDGKERVEEVRALNSDAEIVLEEMNLSGVDLNVAVNAIIGSMLKYGYLSTDQNSILISVDTDNQKLAEELKNKITNEVGTLLGKNNIEASVITQSFEKNSENDKKAEENGISKAKSALISKIISAELLDANGVPYTYETLAALNVNELKLILESKSLQVDGINSSGAASDKKYLSRDEVLSIAYQKAGIASESATRIDVEFDYDDDFDIMVYEVEFFFEGMEYEYEINAKTGEILEEKIKPDDDEDDETPTALPEGSISREEALAIAFNKANLNSADVRRPEIEIDRERGSYVYEIEFKYGGMEYEYVIDAENGAVIEESIEADD